MEELTPEAVSNPLDGKNGQNTETRLGFLMQDRDYLEIRTIHEARAAQKVGCNTYYNTTLGTSINTNQLWVPLLLPLPLL